VKIKYDVRLKHHISRDGIPPKICASVIILALSSSGAKGKYFLTSAQGSLRNLTLKIIKIPFEGLDHYPKVSKQKNGGVRQVGFVPLCPPPLQG
jgi:hypothetical protein